MGAATCWDNLPLELVSVIAQKVDCLDSLIILSAVCKSWNSAVSELKLLLPPKDPWLLLAEEDPGLDLNSVLVAELEAIPCMVDPNYIDNKVDVRLADNNDEGDNNNDVDDNGDNNVITSICASFQSSSTTRGFYSLAKQKSYCLDLPEAAGRIILGTNKGWLVTLGEDLKINLLHPLMRYQIPLPPMLTLPHQYEYNDDFQPQEIYTMFLAKVVMSSQGPRQSRDACNRPTIMAIYGKCEELGFARLGDELWKPVTGASLVHDIVYHKEKFYAIDFRGKIFKCDVDDKKEEGQCIQITSVPVEKDDLVTSYLIESLLGSHLWVVLRFRKGVYYEASSRRRYYTSDFLVFKLEIIQYRSTNFDDIASSCKWSGEVNSIGNEALFIGRNSSISLAATSEFIKPNSIYFTDDGEFFHGDGGGHDMGIFNIKNGAIEPHYPGTSIHRFTPPVWYI
ncbi:F-box protein At2g26160-like [Apium graveolens]|uniref:F-box protein At2g26160-like n=1 Tax=Apium graveolens TaxID=4045 RepID=UPI003D7B1A94